MDGRPLGSYPANPLKVSLLSDFGHE